MTAGSALERRSSIAALYAPGALSPYPILDLRRANFGTVLDSGVDFYGGYIHAFNWRLFFSNLSGTHVLEQKDLNAGLPPVDLLAAGGVSQTQVSGTVGTTWRRLTSGVTMSYSSGFQVAGIPGQTSVGAFHPVNLMIGYALAGKRWWNRNLSISFNIDNLLNERPAFENSSFVNGIGNGSTIGRLVNLGLHVVF